MGVVLIYIYLCSCMALGMVLPWELRCYLGSIFDPQCNKDEAYKVAGERSCGSIDIARSYYCYSRNKYPHLCWVNVFTIPRIQCSLVEPPHCEHLAILYCVRLWGGGVRGNAWLHCRRLSNFWSWLHEQVTCMIHNLHFTKTKAKQGNGNTTGWRMERKKGYEELSSRLQRFPSSRPTKEIRTKTSARIKDPLTRINLLTSASQGGLLSQKVT